MKRIRAPKLGNYGTAIQANNSMANIFNNISNGINKRDQLKETKRHHMSDEVFEKLKFNAKKEESKWGQLFKENKYQHEQSDLSNKRTANATAIKTLYPKVTSKIGEAFGQVPSVENANKMDNVLGNMDIGSIEKKNRFGFDLNKFETSVATDKRDHIYKANQDSISNNQNQQKINVSKEKNNKTSGRKTNEILNFMAINKDRAEKGLNAMSFEEFYNNKSNTKKMGVGLRDADSVKRETERVSKVIGINAYQMSNQDFSNLDSQQRYEMNNLIAYREQGLKSKVPDWMKKNLDNLSAVVYSAGEVSKSLSSNDSGLIEASFNKVNQYLGFGDSSELAKRTLTQSNYQLYSNYMLKSLSGLAVTKPEETRFTKAFGSLFMSDSIVAMKAKTNMQNLAFRLETMKKSYDPITFNYRFGHLQRNVNNAVARMDSTIASYSNNSPAQNQNFVNADGSQYQNIVIPNANSMIDKSQPQMIPQADNSHKNEEGQIKQRIVIRTGMYQGQKVIEYSDGSVDYE